MRMSLRPIWGGVFFLALIAGWPAAAVRADVTLHAELSNEATSTTTTNKENGNVTDSDRNRFEQLYNLDIARQFFPNLSFRGGGIFQFTDERNKSEGVTTNSGTDLLHPYVDLNLTNPIFTTGFGFEKTQMRQTGTGQLTTTDTRDQMHGRFLWAPVDLPRLNLNYTTSHRFDDQATTDLEQDDFNLSLRYNWKEIFTNYSFIQGKSNDLLSGLRMRHDAHDGRISFSRELMKDLNLSASYRATYGTDKWTGGGTPFLTPVISEVNRGFHIVNDSSPADWDATVETGNAPFLVNNLTAGEKDINLGLNGTQFQAQGFGLELGSSDTSVDAIRVWLDGDEDFMKTPLRADAEQILVNMAKGWSVYIAIDGNKDWELTTYTPVQVSYDRIDHYLEFTLNIPSTISDINYIKIVATPLSTDPTGDLKDIYVTEVDALIFSQGDSIRRNFENSADMGLLWRLDPKTSMGYSVFYRTQRTDSEMLMQRNSALSQTVNMNRIINRIFSSSIRGSREDRQTPVQETLDYSYGASLAAGWLDTFRQSLSYSGSWSELERLFDPDRRTPEVTKTNSLMLRNVAQLYRGWSANVDFGYTWSTPWDAGKRYSKIFRVETSVIPNPKLTVNSSFTYSRALSDQPPTEDKRLELSAAFSPTSAISVFGRCTVIDQSETSKVYQNYSIDWSPFPDGAIQFFVAYNESLTDEGDDSKSSLAGFDWRVNHGTVLRTSYSMSESESETSKTESEIISVTIRISL